ncbi:MAG: Hypothetical protein AJITA_00558 [Acetilactobacillus jinshanensis]
MTPKEYRKITENRERTLRLEHQRNEAEKNVIRKMRKSR